MRKALLVLLISILTAPTTACDKGLAYGDYNAVIVVAPEAWWPTLRDSVFNTLSPDIFSLREERTFRVTYQAPMGIEFSRLQRFKETVLIGGPEEEWMAEALATLDEAVTPEVPGIVEAEDVWAKNQIVTMVLVDPDGDIPEQVFSLVGEVHTRLDERFRQGALTRMFISGAKTDLADSLYRAVGFSLTLPEVYRWVENDSLFIFRNDNPDPSELIRQFGVTWRTPIPEGFSPDSLMHWKEVVSDESYGYPQLVDRDGTQIRRLAKGNMEINEVRGAWTNPPGGWPAAGPFILWSVSCPEQNRLYFIDAWLYAPGKEKWEYMIQLETILNSFRCNAGMGAGPRMGD
jgi:hypothetical protein